MAEPINQPEALEQLRGLLELLQEARIRTDERARATHGRFNVFTTLLAAHDEVCLHTRFLHCLLDPRGCHDCGSLFLDLFCSMLKEHPGVGHNDAAFPIEIPPSDAPWKVEKEVTRFGFGRMDLLLERPGLGIAIENKIYASEQEDQLARYASYLAQHPGGKGWVIYLTLGGERSVTHQGAVPYIRISYGDHVLTWLNNCLRASYDLPVINQVILQYREVVRYLTGKSENPYMKDIAKFITNYPDIIRFRKQIDEGIRESLRRIL